MKPFVFNKDSWHYWLAKDVGNFPSWQDTSDICTYARAVAKGAMIAGVVMSVLAFMAYWITITLVWWAVVIQHGFFNEPGPIVLSTIVAIFTVAFIIGDGIPWLFRKARLRWYKMKMKSTYREAMESVETDSFLSEAYRSWKEKTCVRVTLVGNDEDN